MLKACQACGHLRAISGACPKCGWLPRRLLSTAERGYGGSHQQLHARFEQLVASGVVVCPRCTKLIQPGEPWDLGHTADRSGHTGPEHAECNRSAAGKAAATAAA